MSWLDWLRQRAKELNGGAHPTPAADAAQPHDADRLPEREQTTDAVADRSGLDFYSAIAAHQRWKNRLMAYVRGQSQERLDAAVVGRRDACELGVWLRDLAPDPRIPEHLLEALRREHARFHELAADVVRLADRGDTEQALQALRASAPYNRCSHQVIGLLSRIYLELSEFHQPGARG